MQLRILTRDLDVTDETRHAIERQVRLVVGRYAAGIVRLQLTLARDGRTPNGGSAEHHCRIRADLGHGESLVVADDDADPVGAAAGAAWRIHRRLRQRPTARERALS